MKLAFNATALLSPWTGVGQYTSQLARQLAGLDGLDTDFFCGLSWSKSVRSVPHPAAARLLPAARRWIPGAYVLRRTLQSVAFSRHTRSHRFSLYHEPNFLPLPFDGPIAVTVHDLSWIRFPETHPPERVRALDRQFEKGLRTAQAVIADSAFVRTEIIELFGLDPASVDVVPLAADPIFAPISADGHATLQRFGLEPRRYFIAVATLEPRKNLIRVLQAYRQLAPSIRARSPLLLVGLSGWKDETLNRELRPLLASGCVRRLGYLPREVLAALMGGALALVYPSLYEGFGLPPLEAMQCGVPAIVSTGSSLQEVVGDTGIAVDPMDTDAIASAMSRLQEDTQLRDLLGARGLERSGQFSWQRCAAEMVATYRKIVPR